MRQAARDPTAPRRQKHASGDDVYARDQHNRKPVDYTTPGCPSAGCLSFYESEYLRSACFTLRYVVVSALSQKGAAQA